VALIQGDRGLDVKILQDSLKRLGYNCIIDGDFGPKTTVAVIKFQKDHGLSIDGIVGPKTRKVLADKLAEKPLNWQSSKYFKPIEFKCKCCGILKISEELIIKLNKLREKIGKPLVINSGYRCLKYNKSISGSPKSQHLLGNAADVNIPAGWTVDSLADVGAKVGFKGIGRYYKQNFVHLDVRENYSRWTDEN